MSRNKIQIIEGFELTKSSLSVPPSYIDVIATNTVNRQTYTIAANESWSPTQAITWDTNEYTKTTNLPFVVATYTLMVSQSTQSSISIKQLTNLTRSSTQTQNQQRSHQQATSVASTTSNSASTRPNHTRHSTSSDARRAILTAQCQCTKSRLWVCCWGHAPSPF